MAGLAPLGPSALAPEDNVELSSVKTRNEALLLAGGAVLLAGLVLESRLARWAIAGGAGLIAFVALDPKKK